MDSDEDMHDAVDLESVDDDFYSGETGMDGEDGGADYNFVDHVLDDSEDITSRRQQVMGWENAWFFCFFPFLVSSLS